MRLFVAIPLPAPLREELAALGRGIEKLKALKPGAIHLTLQFLGEMEAAGPVVGALRPVAAGHAAFEMELKGLLAFPPRGRARVVWVGLGRGEMEAASLAAAVAGALEPVGLRPERRPWHGHVTIGRFRAPRQLPSGILDSERFFGVAPAQELVVYRSTLTPEGALHEAVAELSLGDGK